MPEFKIPQQILETGFLSLADSIISGSLTLASGALVFPDGTEQTTAGGGGGSGTPGGSTGQIQYNNNGVFGGTSTITFVGGTLRATGSFSGSLTGQLTGTASFVTGSTFTGTNIALSSSFAISSSRATSSSFAATSSFVTNLNQTLTVGNITNTPAKENTLNVYPPITSVEGEGGQILLAASGGLYTSAAMLDNWQNQFRVLKGTNTEGSTVAYIITNLETGNTQFAGAVTASAYSGLPNDYLYATRNTSQNIPGEANWANRDIIFNNLVASKGISYNTGTGIASLTGGKVYRITARLAWSAAGNYTLQFSCYNSSNSQLGPTVQTVQPTDPSYNISDGTLDFIYAPGSNTDVKIRTTGNTTALDGESIRGDLNTQLIIQQIA